MTFTVYLSGPMRGLPRFNADAFDAAQDWLAHGPLKWEVISPVELDRAEDFDFDGPAPDPRWVRNALARDMLAIERCDAVVLLPGWEQSEGVRTELRHAMSLGLQLYILRGGPDWSVADLRPLAYDDAVAILSPPEPQVRDEVRVIDPDTGGAKGSKLARFDLIPPGPLYALAEHYGRGAEKYDARNWERGTAWSLNFAALQRHAWAFWSGEDIDPDTGSPHLVAVAWHAFALLEFARTHPEKDDRSGSLG